MYDHRPHSFLFPIQELHIHTSINPFPLLYDKLRKTCEKTKKAPLRRLSLLILALVTSTVHAAVPSTIPATMRGAVTIIAAAKVAPTAIVASTSTMSVSTTTTVWFTMGFVVWLVEAMLSVHFLFAAFKASATRSSASATH